MGAPEVLLALGTSKYAACRHGWDHRAWCGYAHKTGDIEFPHKFNWRMWICSAHEPRGHAGIDLFVGQVYTGGQYDRVIQMVHAETLQCTARWARMFAWFNCYGDANEYITDGDFGLYDLLEGHQEIIFNSMNSMEQVRLGTCTTYLFPLAVDDKGRTLQDRMARRLECVTEFPALFAVSDWHDDGDVYECMLARRLCTGGQRVGNMVVFTEVRCIILSVGQRTPCGTMYAGT